MLINSGQSGTGVAAMLSLDRAGPTLGLDRAGPTLALDRAGPTLALDRAGPTQGLDRAGPMPARNNWPTTARSPRCANYATSSDSVVPLLPL